MRPVRRGTGHLPDQPGGAWRRASELFGAAPRPPAPPTSQGVLAWAPPPVDQGQDESCVGEATAAAIATLVHRLTGTLTPISSRYIWYLARAADHNTGLNIGSRPFAAYAALAQRGYCTESEWPRAMPYGRAPDADALRGSADQVDVQAYRIADAGDARCEAIRQALAVEQRPITVALQVDASYMAGPALWRPGGAAYGGHYVTCTHYNETGVYTLGSYGRAFGQAGYVQVPWPVIGNPLKASDLYVVSYARQPSVTLGPGLVATRAPDAGHPSARRAS